MGVTFPQWGADLMDFIIPNARAQIVEEQYIEGDATELVLDSIKREYVYTPDFEIEIKSIDVIEEGYQILVAATDVQGEAVGFGDGTVEIEKLRIINPPEYIPDGTFTEICPKGELECYQLENVTYNPVEAMQQIVEDFVTKNALDSEEVVQGKIGSTVTRVYAYQDGNVANGEGTPWSQIHDATDGNAIDETDPVARAYNNGAFAIYRGYSTFDTSSIGSDTIATATLGAYVTTKWNADNDGNDFISVTDAEPASTTSWGTADYDKIGQTGAILEYADRKDITTDITTSSYLIFTFTATGTTYFFIFRVLLIKYPTCSRVSLFTRFSIYSCS